MPTFLFDQIIFGPVKSRRLGVSLGINLLPVESKLCNFNCIYCECGLNTPIKDKVPSYEDVVLNLEKYLIKAQQDDKQIDALTFAGNGEPTLHPKFSEIIDATFTLRNKYYPKAQIALLTNATTIVKDNIRQSFSKIDQSILKLDSVHPETVQLLNDPVGNFDLDNIIDVLKKMEKPIIQTMFVRGSFNGKIVDNSTDTEVDDWLDTLKEINPSVVMIYTIARDTPVDSLTKVPFKKLEEIGERVKKLGFEVQISG